MTESAHNRLQGVLFALSAGILWGLVPVYINFLGDVDALTVVAHRSLWSLVLLFGLVFLRRQINEAFKILSKNDLLVGVAISTFFLSANWIIYVYAVQSGNVVSAALGYFVYPIFTVLLSIIFLGERLDRWAFAAVSFVACGVFAKAVLIKGLPWIAMLLAMTFSLYAVARKRLNIDPILGLFVETLLLLPITLGFFVWLAWSDQSIFFGDGANFVFLSMFFGVLTVAPLVLFHAGNQALTMTTSSLLFYSNPTTQLLIATVLLGEIFSMSDLIAFGPIWLGILVYFLTRQRPVRSTLTLG